MTALLIGLCGAILLWTFIARRLDEWRVTASLLLLVLGVLVGLVIREDVADRFDTAVAEKVVEFILAVLLFVDATEVRGGFFGGERAATLRLLLIGLPLSLLCAAALGFALVDNATWSIALVLACIAMPTDFGATAAILRSDRLPVRVRHVLNVESGYNDGVIAPIFLVALAWAGPHPETAGSSDDIEHALTSMVGALLIGVAVGGLAGYLTRLGAARHWHTAQSVRITMVAVPIASYAIAGPFDANAFVAAFIAGLAYRAARTARSDEVDIDHAELSLVDDIGVLAAMSMWFVLGAISVLVFESGFRWQLLVFAVLVLTVARAVPVYLSLLGTSFDARDRLAIGFLGPRGAATIVFGLLAFRDLSAPWDDVMLYVTASVVIGSIILHSIAARPLMGRSEGSDTAVATQ